MDLLEQVKHNLLKHLHWLSVDKSWFSIVTKVLISWQWEEFSLVSSSAEHGDVLMSLIVYWKNSFQPFRNKFKSSKKQLNQDKNKSIFLEKMSWLILTLEFLLHWILLVKVTVVDQNFLIIWNNCSDPLLCQFQITNLSLKSSYFRKDSRLRKFYHKKLLPSLHFQNNFFQSNFIMIGV